MEGSSISIVSKARTVFNSAAAKAERVFNLSAADHRDLDKQLSNDWINDLGAELPEERQFKGSNESKNFRWKPPNLGTKQDWQERLKNIGRGRKGIEDTENAESPTMSFALFDENIYLYNEKLAAEAKGLNMASLVDGYDVSNRGIIPPASVMKQLATAIESGKNYKSMKDLLATSRSSSPVRERASLGFSAVKSLMLREKDKLAPESGGDEVLLFIQSALDAEGLTPSRKICSTVERRLSTTTVHRDIHASPPESFIVVFSEVMGSLKTLQKMAVLWSRIVTDLRRLWLEEQYVPGIPADELPDLNSCLLYQKMQVINCCVSRKKRRAIATESLESIVKEAEGISDGSAASKDTIPTSPLLYARINTGELVLRLGADRPADNLTMLETGEPIYAPLTQEGPLLTEDLIRENEEFVLRTRSVGAGCSQLLSDMQAFKAANPGCILEDFVRWHSPPDWSENGFDDEGLVPSACGNSGSTRGRLSDRMLKEGNLWLELWETAKSVPAVNQAPLFDEDLAVEGILTDLEDISPAELFQQLYLSLLGLGFVVAESVVRKDDNMSKLFSECKDYVVTTCQGASWSEKLDDIGLVYDTVEAMLLWPEEVLNLLRQPEEMTTNDEPKRRFKRLRLIFGGRSRSLRKSASKEKNMEEKTTRQPFSNFFDSRSSIFAKKPP
ncbi:Rab3 GTPase-activating protein catalytic subunit-like protein [Drosera capensis]